MIALRRPSVAESPTPTLDPAQQAVVGHTDGPLLVLAGPGTGKTATIVESVVARLAGVGGATVAADRMLVLTFGRRAADELRSRVAARIGGGLMPTIATFHSLCFALVREFADPEAFDSGPRLLSGAEQEQRIRELLTHAVRERRLAWPADLDPAVGTRGLADEVRALIARAQSIGLDASELAFAGGVAGIPAWSAVASFLSEYLDVLDAEGVIDYSELVSRAVLLAQSPDIGRILVDRYRAVFVDEYQDTDPAQVRLLQAMTTPQTLLVAVGDPDQSIYGFRGADVSGISNFGSDFPTRVGAAAPVAVLDVNRRFGSVIRDAALQVIRRVPLAGIPAAAQRAHRSPECARPGPGEVEVITFDSAASQASAVVDSIRRAKLHGQVQSWSQVAVLVRSSARDVPLLHQTLLNAGVPVAVAATDLPLKSQPGVAPLLEVLRIAAEPQRLTAARAEDLLLSPLIRMRPSSLRRLGRALRAQDRDRSSGDGSGVSTTSSARLIQAAIADRTLLLGIPTQLAEPVNRLAALIDNAAIAVAGGESVAEVLWRIWDGTSWPARLERSALSGGAPGRAADRDLDAVVALFDVAGRADVSFLGRRGVASFVAELDRQAVAQSPRERRPQRDAVALMTAHRSKGLAWSRVYVVGAQEGVWPDLRVRGSLLSQTRLGRDGLAPAATVWDTLAEERRLFYVACTRARDRLVVTAVQSPQDSGEQPSRFLDELSSVPGVTRRHEGGFRSVTMAIAPLVAELRSVVEDEQASPVLRRAAARRLARLAKGGVGSANPSAWWGMRGWTESERPVRPADAPVAMSGSSWTVLSDCSLHWFLQHEAKGQTVSGTATGFGSLIHALADAVARGELPADDQVLAEQASRRWGALSYEARWQAQAELAEARAALVRFVTWHSANRGRSLVATEVPFEVEFDAGSDRVVIRGKADRLELDTDEQLHVVDLKTERKAKSAKEIVEHRQLALYQVAAQEGAFDDEFESTFSGAAVGRPVVAGAELVQLRIAGGAADTPKVQGQPAVDGDQIRQALGAAVEVVRAEGFTPTPSDRTCRICDFALVCPARSEGRELTR
ncbi:MAG: ATP-dependent DNA helicase [Actinomycetes bacterium]